MFDGNVGQGFKGPKLPAAAEIPSKEIRVEDLNSIFYVSANLA